MSLRFCATVSKRDCFTATFLVILAFTTFLLLGLQYSLRQRSCGLDISVQAGFARNLLTFSIFPSTGLCDSLHLLQIEASLIECETKAVGVSMWSGIMLL